MGLASTVTYLKESWTSALKSAVKSSLKEIGKGWFNLNETRTEVYAMSKLKRFLKMVSTMQDCVITMARPHYTTTPTLSSRDRPIRLRSYRAPRW